jgi:hypothetical protein
MVWLVTYSPSRWPVRIDRVKADTPSFDVGLNRVCAEHLQKDALTMRLQSAGPTLLAELLDDCRREAGVGSERRPRTAA